MQKSTYKEPYFYSNQKYISFLTLTFNVVKATKIPEYRTKFSKHGYTQSQLLTLIIFKEYLDVKYRQLNDLLMLMDNIKPILGLSQFPHYSTLCKFSHRFSSVIISQVLTKITSLFYRSQGRISTIAIDSTGFPTSYFSYYYSIRTQKERKGFLKLSLAIDTSKQTILALKITKNRQHDSKHVKSLLRNASRQKLANYYVLDKGYDSEAIHSQIRIDLKAISYIPIRNWNAEYVGGTFRQEMANYFDRIKYGKRNLVETVFSVVKRRFGEYVRGIHFRNQVKEIKLKCIAYSIDRFLKNQKIFCMY
jgi:transposase